MLTRPPHFKSLVLIALLNAFGKSAESLCKQLQVRFPSNVTPDDVLKDVLPIDRYTLVKTSLKSDVNIYNEIATELQLQDYTANCELVLPTILLKWREDKTARLFLEVLILCEQNDAQIGVDYKACFNTSINNTALKHFRDLFADLNYMSNESWEVYSDCIKLDETMFKARLLKQPIDYVRWKLGVPVALNSEIVLDRLMSDGYFTIRSIKAEAGDNGIRLSDEDQKRVKFETNVILQVQDRRTKLKQAEAQVNSTMPTDTAEAVKDLFIEFKDHTHKTLDDIL